MHELKHLCADPQLRNPVLTLRLEIFANFCRVNFQLIGHPQLSKNLDLWGFGEARGPGPLGVLGPGPLGARAPPRSLTNQFFLALFQSSEHGHCIHIAFTAHTSLKSIECYCFGIELCHRFSDVFSVFFFWCLSVLMKIEICLCSFDF